MRLKVFGLSVVFACLWITGFSAVTTTSLSVPRADREFRAAWIATVTNIDWPSGRSLSTEEQQDELLRILDMCQKINLNAIIFQVRPACDAFYKSDLEPWSPFLTGTMGTAPDPFWDPLEFIIEETHKRGMELHAWFNPYRALLSSSGQVSSNHISKTNPDIVKTVGDFLWLDPGEQATQDHSYNVIMDVIKRYDIDGVHMDDYFYPYKNYMAKGPDGKYLDFPDSESYAKYKSSGGTLQLEDWRRNNVDVFIERLYKGIKEERKTVKFGLSPFGLYRPGFPSGVLGMDQYTELYADARKWLHEGWTDYYTPQVYWPLKGAQPYKKISAWWCGENKHNRHIWIGNGLHRIADPQNKSWAPQEIVDQVLATRDIPGASGNVFYSVKYLNENYGGVSDLLTSEVYRRRALVPASPWLDNEPPSPPSVEAKSAGGSQDSIVSWAPTGKIEDVRNWVLYTKYSTGWNFDIFPPGVRQAQLQSDANGHLPEHVAVSAVDALGNESGLTNAFLGKSSDAVSEAPAN